MKFIKSIIAIVLLISCGEEENIRYRQANYKVLRKDGSLKAKGDIINGLKSGNWKIYNRKGKLVQERNYTGFYSFDQVFPESFKFKISKDADGRWALPLAKMEDRLWYKRLYRNFEYIDNDFTIPVEAFKKSKLFADRMFESEFDLNDFPEKIDGLHIKEEWFYNKASRQIEVNIIGIAASYKSEALVWVKYDDLKNHIDTRTFNRFFTRNFNSKIYKETQEDATIDFFIGPEHVEELLINHEVSLWPTF